MKSIDHYEEYFYNLNTGIVGAHERPHKPIMLLAVMDLIEMGSLQQNLIPFSKDLQRQFSQYFAVVKELNDRNTPINPFSTCVANHFGVTSQHPGVKQ